MKRSTHCQALLRLKSVGAEAQGGLKAVMGHHEEVFAVGFAVAWQRRVPATKGVAPMLRNQTVKLSLPGSLLPLILCQSMR